MPYKKNRDKLTEYFEKNKSTQKQKPKHYSQKTQTKKTK